MVETIEEQKRMVREILKGSKKPLMAKRIAQLIYRKYSGYRMSRFIVRDILWKEMKGEFDYDRENYTYKLRCTEKRENRSIQKPIFGYNDTLKNTENSSKHEETGEKLNLFDRVPSINNDKTLESIINVLKEKEGYDILNDFRLFIKGSFLNVNTGNEKFDELVKIIVKDNVITDAENCFLKDKTIELGLPVNLIDQVRDYTHSNNPYLDNIIHLIFEDGIISKNELIFLKEKEKEFDFSISFVNQRFWQIGICFYLEELIKYDEFLKLVRLWEIGRATAFELSKSSTWLMIILDIHKSQDLNEILKRGRLKFQKELEEHLYANYNYNTTVIEIFCNELSLNYHANSKQESNIKKLTMDTLIKILNEERRRIGDPAADLLAENILFRIKN